MALKFVHGFYLILLCATFTSAEEILTAQGSNSTPGLRSILRIYDECQRADGGVTMCLKKKAVTFIDRISRIDTVNVGDGVRIVGIENAPIKTGRSLNENELDQMLPRSLEDRDSVLNNLLAEKLASYISGRKIQISLPQVSPTDLGRGLEEGELIHRFQLIFLCKSQNANPWCSIFSNFSCKRN